MAIDAVMNSQASFEKVVSKQDVGKLVAITNIIWNEYYVSIFGKEQVEYMLKNLFSEKVLINNIKNDGLRYFLIKYDNKEG